MRHTVVITLIILTAMLSAACSDRSRPDSPEPTLGIGEATDITRTEATVRATIDRHGIAALSYVRLCYGEAFAIPGDELAIDGDPDLSVFQFRLTGLCPGTSYSCRLHAGTSTASLKSNSISFTTIPNETPKISAITPLSTGPLGIIIRFGIIDDGGDQILEAGCEVKQTGSGESRRIYSTGLNPLTEYLQLNITGLAPTTTYTLTPFASNIQGETRGEPMEYTTTESVVVTEPGMLASLFIDADGNGDTESLSIAGPMNGDDFHTLRTMLGAPGENGISTRVSDIDLSDVSIVEGGGSYDGQHFTIADQLTVGILADCPLLHTAKLPNSATAVERDAFARCLKLESITLPASAESILPSTGCSSLQAIESSPANTHFLSLDGVLLSGDGSQIVWFPCGKTGEYNIPSTITRIGENAFAGTSIITLFIPSTVTSISRGAFAGSALREIILPDNISNIAEGTFQNCSSLTTVSLGAGTEFIGDYAFDGTDLSDLYIAADYPPYANTEAFTNHRKPLTEECTLHVPTGTRKLYQSNSQWGNFTKIDEF